RALPIAVAQRLAHAHFAFAAVVVPAVVQKIDSVVQRRSNDADAFLLVFLIPYVIPAQPHHRNLFARASQRPPRHFCLRVRRPGHFIRAGCQRRPYSDFQNLSSSHAAILFISNHLSAVPLAAILEFVHDLISLYWAEAFSLHPSASSEKMPLDLEF